MIVLGGTTQTMSLGDGDGVQQCEVSDAAIPHSDPDYTTAGILLPDGRVARACQRTPATSTGRPSLRAFGTLTTRRGGSDESGS